MRARIHIVILGIILAGLSLIARAQSDDAPLGDIARSYRKSQAPPQTVIDNDNLPAVMEEGEDRKWKAAPPKPLPQPVQLINMSSPNVTCALSFNANTPDLLANAPRPQRLPDGELAKLDGPAAINGNTLEVSLLNATAWDVREITVSLTLVHKKIPMSAAFLAGAVKLMPATVETSSNDRKEADTTFLYHLHGAAVPYSTAVFRETLERPVEPDEDWHWAIVQAKGMPPAVTPASEQLLELKTTGSAPVNADAANSTPATKPTESSKSAPSQSTSSEPGDK
jgi:hypothetical protein